MTMKPFDENTKPLGKDITVYRPFEIRLDDLDEKRGTFGGRASVFNELLPSYNEIMDKGSFRQTLKMNRGIVPVLYMHTDWAGMGTKAKEETEGLEVEARLDIENTPVARSAWGLMKLAHEVGSNAGLSIGFRTITEIIKSGVRHLKEVALVEWSITPPGFQAGPTAGTSAVRAAANQAQKMFIRECLEEMGIKTPEQRDSGGDADAAGDAALVEALDKTLAKIRRK